MTLITQFKQYGLKNSFARIIKKILRYYGIQIESYILYNQVIDLSKIKGVYINSNYIVKKIAYENYENSCGLKFDNLKLSVFRKRFESPSFAAYGVFDGEKLIYSSWISTKKLEDSINDFGLELDSDEGLLLDILTHPNYRRQGLHNYMNIYCLQKIKEHRKEKAVVMVLKENIPARRSQERSGFKKSKIIKYYSIWGNKRVVIKNLNSKLS